MLLLEVAARCFVWFAARSRLSLALDAVNAPSRQISNRWMRCVSVRGALVCACFWQRRPQQHARRVAFRARASSSTPSTPFRSDLRDCVPSMQSPCSSLGLTWLCVRHVHLFALGDLRPIHAMVVACRVFQGGEKDVILLSCVRTNGIGFIDSPNRCVLRWISSLRSAPCRVAGMF